MKKRLNALIISYYFGPSQLIGAIRATKLAKFLKNKGHNVFVITAKNTEYFETDKLLLDDIKNLKHIYRIFTMDQYWISKSIKKILGFKNNHITVVVSKGRYIGSGKISFIKNLFDKILKRLSFLNNIWILFSLPVINRLLSNKKFDIVFSTFPPIYTHYLGYYIKKKRKNIFWIADYRDPHINNPHISPKFINKIFQIYFEKKIYKNADIITTVANGTIPSYKRKTIEKEKKFYVITNGYDSDDIKNIKVTRDKNYFRIIYAGTLSKLPITKYDRDPRLFMEVLSKFKNNRKVKFVYLGKYGYEMMELVKKYSLTDIYEYKGYVERVDTLKEMLKSHIALLLVWGHKDVQGMISGKFYEYVMTGCRILCVINGNRKYAEVDEMIKNYKLGLSVDTEKYNTSKDLIYNYLLREYNKFVKGDFKPNKPVQQFNYKNITNKILEIYYEKK